MAKRQLTQVVDDLDGKALDADGKTIRSSIDGRSYEIDLTPVSQERLLTALEPFVTVAPRIPSSRRSRRA